MRKPMKWMVGSLAGLLGLVVLALALVYGLSQHRMARVYPVDVTVPAVPTDRAAVARGAHLAAIRGCRDCHADDLGGATFIDSPPFARLSGTNLTPAGAGGDLSDLERVRAIRHGVGPTGRSLLFMPAQEFARLSDADLGDLLAYLHSVPPVHRTLPPNRVGPIGRALFLAGKVPLLPAEIVDHAAVVPAQPVAGPTAAYGAYLAAACAGCHGPGFSGGHIPGTPPDWPDAANLTPDPSGLAQWNEADFRKALREGIAPGGRPLKTDYMPVRVTRQLSDDEVAALFAFMRSLPPKRHGLR